MEWWLTCIKKYVTFEGRARRKEYWMFILFNVIFMFAAMLLDVVLFGASPTNPAKPRYLSSLFGLFVFLPSLTAMVRRLHDIGRSGWWVAGYYGLSIFCAILITVGGILALGGKGIGGLFTIGGALAILVAAVWMIVWMCKDSQPETNKYGPNPKEIAE